MRSSVQCASASRNIASSNFRGPPTLRDRGDAAGDTNEEQNHMNENGPPKSDATLEYASRSSRTSNKTLCLPIVILIYSNGRLILIHFQFPLIFRVQRVSVHSLVTKVTLFGESTRVNILITIQTLSEPPEVADDKEALVFDMVAVAAAIAGREQRLSTTRPRGRRGRAEQS